MNTVHDEVVVECEERDADAVCHAVREEMQGAGADVIHHVPVAADVLASEHWDK